MRVTGSRCMTARRTLTLVIAAMVAIAGLRTGVAGDRTFDLTKKVWVDGRTVAAFVLMPRVAGGRGPDEPSAAYEDVDVYLIGAVDEDNPYGPELRRPAVDLVSGKPLAGPDGAPSQEIVIPAHDDTFARFAGADTPVDTFGHWVIAGPRASAATVRTRQMPAGSLAGAPLAYAVRLDDEWQPLTDAAIIRRGLDRGLLALKFSNWGGVAWLEELPAERADRLSRRSREPSSVQIPGGGS